jgi:hypothetical protein
VWMQIKGSEDEGDPYATLSNADGDNLHVRVNYNGIGGASTNIWSAGMTWAQLRGHALRWMMRIYFHEPDGTIEFWWAMDDDDMVKQTLLGGSTVWTGPTMNVAEPAGETRLSDAHYADSRYLFLNGQTATSGNVATGRHRAASTGMEAIYGTDPNNIWAVEPPALAT